MRVSNNVNSGMELNDIDRVFNSFLDSKAPNIVKNGEYYDCIDVENMVFVRFNYDTYLINGINTGFRLMTFMYDEFIGSMLECWKNKEIRHWFHMIISDFHNKVIPILYEYYKDSVISKEEFWDCFSVYWEESHHTQGRLTQGRHTLANYFKTNYKLDKQLASLSFDENGYTTVYRGENSCSQSYQTFGLSWTYKKYVAEWYSTRYGTYNNPVVYSVRVHKDDILAVFNDRSDFEVVVDASRMDVERVSY